MEFDADNPVSPLFIVLLAGVLLDVVVMYFGFVNGELPNVRTSVRGARIAGVMSLFSLIALGFSYYYFSEYTESFGAIALIVAGGLFVGGIFLAERIPD